MKKQKSYESAFNLAVNNLKKLSFNKFLEKIKFAGAEVLSANESKCEAEFKISLFQHFYKINFPEFNFTSDTEKVISLVTKIIILHYIELSENFFVPSGELVSYKHIPGAFNYYPVFRKKVILPILNEKLTVAGLKNVSENLGAEIVELGDFSFRVKAFPNIYITVIYYEGDEDFESSLDFLFDSSVQNMLSLEDIVVISQMLSKRILFYLRQA
jgi:hypothetical protein